MHTLARAYNVRLVFLFAHNTEEKCSSTHTLVTQACIRRQHPVLGGDLDGPADETVTARFVCDWSIGDDQIEGFLNLL